jgi:hypothetical protein
VNILSVIETLNISTHGPRPTEKLVLTAELVFIWLWGSKGNSA